MGSLDGSFVGRALMRAAAVSSGRDGGGPPGDGGDPILPNGMKKSTAEYIKQNERRFGTTAANSPDRLDREAYRKHAASINSKLNNSAW